MKFKREIFFLNSGKQSSPQHNALYVDFDKGPKHKFSVDPIKYTFFCQIDNSKIDNNEKGLYVYVNNAMTFGNIIEREREKAEKKKKKKLELYCFFFACCGSLLWSQIDTLLWPVRTTSSVTSHNNSCLACFILEI